MKTHQQRNNTRLMAGLLFLSLFSISLAATAEWVQWRVEDGGNGHFYEIIFVPGEISWPEANVAALRVNRFSHLATITSQEENDFVTNLLQPYGFGWIGGIQTDEAVSSADGWRWATEEAFIYTNWGLGEPNDLPFEEIFLEINSTGEWNDCCGPIDVSRPLYVVESTILAESEVTIDIKPGTENNSVNPRSKGKLTVAILTTDGFDASTVNASTVRFGPGEAQPVSYQLEDVDYEGYLDLALKFETQDTGIACGDTEATLSGQTFDGVQIIGTDAIKTVGCNRK